MRKSRRQEDETAKEVGGRRTIGSGNQWHSKGDVSSREWLIENKHTDKSSYRLSLVDLRKLETHSLMEGKKPALMIQFGTNIERYVVLPASVAIELGFKR